LLAFDNLLLEPSPLGIETDLIASAPQSPFFAFIAQRICTFSHLSGATYSTGSMFLSAMLREWRTQFPDSTGVRLIPSHWLDAMQQAMA
jgi:hypothetical protein